MLKSMTAYGRASGVTDTLASKEIIVELKSVNSRYLDLTVKTGRAYGFLEEKVKAHIKRSGITRGKMDIYVGINVLQDSTREVHLDKAFAESYIGALRALRDEYALPDDITTMSVARNGDVLTFVRSEEDVESVWNEVLPFVDAAIADFNTMRTAEGVNLAADLAAKKSQLEEMAKDIETRASEYTANYRTKLEARLAAVLNKLDISVDEQRIVTECAIFADKTSVDEELVRLRSHFSAYDEMLNSDEAIGRKLDFLVQEINREINTIGSKCNEIESSAIVIEMKHLLEKIREQVQNIE